MPTLIALALIALVLGWLLRSYQRLSFFWTAVAQQWQQSLELLKNQHHQLNSLISSWSHYPRERTAGIEELKQVEQQLAYLILQGSKPISNEESMSHLLLCEERLRVVLDRYSQSISAIAEDWQDEVLARHLCELEMAYCEQIQHAQRYNQAANEYNEQIITTRDQIAASLFAFSPALLFDAELD